MVYSNYSDSMTKSIEPIKKPRNDQELTHNCHAIASHPDLRGFSMGSCPSVSS